MTAMEKKDKTLNVPNLRFPEFSGEWEKCTLGDFGNVITGNTPPTAEDENYDNGTHLWASPADLGATKYIESTQTLLSDRGFEKSRSFPANSILVTCIGSTIGKMGMSKTEMASNQQINTIVPVQHDANFVYYAVQSRFPRYLSSIAVQAVPILSKSSFEKLTNYTTARKEQIKIGNLLSLIDERIDTQKKIIEDLKKLKDAINYNNLFDQSWKEYKISEISVLGRGRVISTIEISKQERPQYPVYSSQTSNNGIMGYLDDYDFDGEYITWTTDGANAGTVFYRNGRFNCTNVCGTIKVDKNIDAYFLSVVLQSATAKYVSINLANPKLMNNTMASIKVKLPDIDTQKYWSRILRHIDKKIETEFQYENLLIQQKAYLLSQMFI